jgi:hypothetical protein
MRSYRRDRWLLQSQLVETWSEKGTVRGTLAPLLYDLGVAFRVMHGHTSWTEVHNVAEECRADHRPLTAFYVGDYDPSGIHMSAVDLPKRFAELGVDVTVKRLAIHGEYAHRQQLPSFSTHTKKSDTRYKWFLQEYGETCWELDAMSPVDLRGEVEAAIKEVIDWDAWRRCEVAEQAEQRSLRHVLGNWRTAISGQATE